MHYRYRCPKCEDEVTNFSGTGMYCVPCGCQMEKVYTDDPTGIVAKYLDTHSNPNMDLIQSLREMGNLAYAEMLRATARLVA